MAQSANATLCFFGFVAMIDVSASGCCPLCNMRLAERVERYVLPAREMESCVEPGGCIKVYPTGPMTNAGVEAIFDLRDSAPARAWTRVFRSAKKLSP